jgi:hypothetical protein
MKDKQTTLAVQLDAQELVHGQRGERSPVRFLAPVTRDYSLKFALTLDLEETGR